MPKRLPKTVFVYVKQYDEGVDTMRVVANAADALEGEPGAVRVGKYELVEYADVAAIPTVLPVSPKMAMTRRRPTAFEKRIAH